MGPSYKAMLGTHVHNEMQSLIKWRKRENLNGKEPLPKREMKRHDAWMDGVIKTSH